MGTRPEAIKLAPVAHALARRGLRPTLIFTGQHPKLSSADFGLSRFPSQALQCPGREDPHRHVHAVTASLLQQLSSLPDLLVVQGDTSSALGGALAGFTAGIPVAHVEAGLRTHDPLQPWPEEEYRVAIDAGADLLFAPTETSAANLRAEAVPGEVHVTGNTSIDAVLAAEDSLPPPRRQSESRSILVTCHRRESWGEGLKSIAAAVAELAQDAAVHFVLHPNPHVAKATLQSLERCVGVTVLPPCNHREMLQRVREANLVLSDSGGIQEEAPALGVPLLVLREKTERPEGVAAGCALLVGTSTGRIVAEARRLLRDHEALSKMAERRFPYGDGKAGEKIAAMVDEWLSRSRGATATSGRSPGQAACW